MTNEERAQKRFEIKKEIRATTIPSFRISVRAFEKIKEISARNNVPMQEVIRQMIDFALENQ